MPNELKEWRCRACGLMWTTAELSPGKKCGDCGSMVHPLTAGPLTLNLVLSRDEVVNMAGCIRDLVPESADESFGKLSDNDLVMKAFTLQRELILDSIMLSCKRWKEFDKL